MTNDPQWRTGWVATVIALVVVAGFVAGKAARDAILLSNFGIKTLPIFITISTLIAMPVILVAGKLMTRFGPARLMPALNLLSAAFAVVEWLLLARYPRPTAIAIYFHLSTSGAVLVSGFWSIINERFDVQRAKHHIGRIAMGATLGGIAGGMIAHGTAVYLVPDAILLVLAGLQLACAVALYLSRDTSIRPPSPPRFALGVVTRSRLLRNLGIMVVLGAVAAGVLDYVFKADIVATASSGGLLRSLAIYYMVTSVFTAVVQVAICGPLIARLGVPRSVATLPLVVTAFGLVALAVPAALAAMIARGAEAITRSSIYRAGYELLYAPLSEADKRPTKIVLDVGAERIGDLVGAQLVALVVYLMVDPRIGLLIATVATGAIAVVFAIRLPRSYTRALEDCLVARDPDFEQAAKPFATWPIGGPILGQAGDLSPLPLRILDHPRLRRPMVALTAAQRDQVSLRIAELRSQDPDCVKRALETALTPELAALVTDPNASKNQRVPEDQLIASAHDGGQRDEAKVSHAGSALEDVSTMLGLALPMEPLRIALHAVQTDDSALRETALEYLESILPADVRIQLWPLLETDRTTRAAVADADAPTPVRNPRSRDELVAALNLAYPTIRASMLDKRSSRP